MVNIDRLDAEILASLSTNPRSGAVELADILGVSRQTFQVRLRKLMDSGILVGFQPIIDLSLVGMPVEVMMSLEIDQREMAAVLDGLRELPHVLEVRIQAGREDLLAHCALESLEALQELTEAMMAIKGIKKATSTFSISTPVPYRVQPLMDHLTEGKGRGRTTPNGQ